MYAKNIIVKLQGEKLILRCWKASEKSWNPEGVLQFLKRCGSDDNQLQNGKGDPFKSYSL